MKTANEYPRDQWKSYIIHYSGGVSPTLKVEAPNKTYARNIAEGCLKGCCRIVWIEEGK